MSQLLVQQYLNEIDRLRKFTGSVTEGVISEAFKDLIVRHVCPLLSLGERSDGR
jgi:hypothetical protein